MPCRAPERREEVHRQLVGHVQPPARHAHAQVMPYNALRTAPDGRVLRGRRIICAVRARPRSVRAAYEAPERGRILVYLRQGIKAPPAAVFVREVLEVVPVVVWRFRALARTLAREGGATVEVQAVVASVREHAVQHHAHTALCGLGAQFAQVVLGAHARVYRQVVRRIVPVIGGRQEYRVYVQHAYAQQFQIVQLCDYAAQIAAEEVARRVIAVGGYVQQRLFVPVGVFDLLSARLCVGCGGGMRGFQPAARAYIRAEEPVREYLIHRALAQPARRHERRVVHGYLIRRRLGIVKPAQPAQMVVRIAIHIVARAVAKDKIIPAKAGRAR